MDISKITHTKEKYRCTLDCVVPQGARGRWDSELKNVNV